MELVPGGSLLNYLRSNADKLPTKALLGNVLLSFILAEDKPKYLK